MEPNTALEPSTLHYKKTLVLMGVLLILILIIGAIVLERRPSEEVIMSTENVVSENLAGTIPEEFLSTLIINSIEVKESYKMSYPDRDIILYTVSFISSQSKKEIYGEYLDLMKKDNYEFELGATDEDAGYLYGLKSEGDLSILISQLEEGAKVQIGLAVKQNN
jgi:hypothetical protein